MGNGPNNVWRLGRTASIRFTTVASAVGHRFVALGRTRIEGRAEPVLVYAPASLSSADTLAGSGRAASLPTQTEDRAHAGSGIGV